MVWKTLRTIFRRRSSPASAGPAATLLVEPSPQEPLARFLFNRKHYAREKGRVKPRAFQPAREDYKTSVFRIIDLAEDEVWGTNTPPAIEGKPKQGRCCLSTK